MCVCVRIYRNKHFRFPFQRGKKEGEHQRSNSGANPFGPLRPVLLHTLILIAALIARRASGRKKRKFGPSHTNDLLCGNPKSSSYCHLDAQGRSARSTLSCRRSKDRLLWSLVMVLASGMTVPQIKGGCKGLLWGLTDCCAADVAHVWSGS